MKQLENGGIVFESTTEARIASELVFKEFGADISSDEFGLEPPLPPSQRLIGPIDATNRRIEDHLGTSKPQEYVIADAIKAEWVVKALSVTSMPRNILFPPHFTKVFRRKSYMAQRVREFHLAKRQQE